MQPPDPSMMGTKARKSCLAIIETKYRQITAQSRVEFIYEKIRYDAFWEKLRPGRKGELFCIGIYIVIAIAAA